VGQQWAEGDKELAGTLSLVYDHHHSELAQKLTEIQHDDHDLIVSVLHVHLDHHNCLEVLVLKGSAERIKGLADRLIATKGVVHGHLGLTTTGQDLP
jgi:CopG family nickel-responsive transcriptional regulator